MQTIYVDAIGRPESKAIISVFGASYGKPGTGRLSLASASNCPEREWPYVSKDVSGIVAEMESDGWTCTVTQDGYGAPLIRLIHTATQAVIDKAAVAAADKFANAQKGYIRFGKCPKGGRSVNHRDNTLESGVSVFEAEFIGKDYRVLVDSVLEVSYLSAKDRPAYRIYGEVVGTGADGEPVLKVSKTIKL